MPIFEYKCTKCNKEVDRLVSHSKADNPQPCSCGADMLRIDKISSTNFSLKGNWFKNNQRY